MACDMASRQKKQNENLNTSEIILESTTLFYRWGKEVWTGECPTTAGLWRVQEKTGSLSIQCEGFATARAQPSSPVPSSEQSLRTLCRIATQLVPPNRSWWAAGMHWCQVYVTAWKEEAVLRVVAGISDPANMRGSRLRQRRGHTQLPSLRKPCYGNKSAWLNNALRMWWIRILLQVLYLITH